MNLSSSMAIPKIEKIIINMGITQAVTDKKYVDSAGFSKQYPDILKALGENRSKQVQSSLSAFHTMLGIGGIQTRYRLDEYSVASGKYHPTELLYLDDHDEAIPQEDAKF